MKTIQEEEAHKQKETHTHTIGPTDAEEPPFLKIKLNLLLFV